MDFIFQLFAEMNEDCEVFDNQGNSDSFNHACAEAQCEDLALAPVNIFSYVNFH